MSLVVNKTMTEKEALVVADHCQVAQLAGEVCLGRVGVKENQSNIIDILTSSVVDHVLAATGTGFYQLACSANGKYILAYSNNTDISGNYLLYLSSDFGTTWSSNASASTGYGGCAMSADGKVMAAIRTLGAFGNTYTTSFDYGQTWSSLYLAIDVSKAVAMSSDGKIHVCAYKGSCSISFDYGATWSSIIYDADTTAAAQSIATSSDGKIIAILGNYYNVPLSQTSSKIYLSTDFGASFTVVVEFVGSTANGIALSSDGKHIFTTYAQNMYYSHNYGSTWSHHTSGFYAPASCVVLSADGRHMLASQNNGSSGNICYSSDYGVNWSDIANARQWVQLATSSDLAAIYLSFTNTGLNISTLFSSVNNNGSLKIATSAYDQGHYIMGNYHFWVDASGRLRIKNGAPTSATDGTVVGTQS